MSGHGGGHTEPAVHDDKKVNSGAQSCPLQAHAQCEMAKLKIKVRYRCFQWAEPPKDMKFTTPDLLSPIDTELETDRIKRNDYITRSERSRLAKDVVALLGQYDFVIDSLASFRTREKAPETNCEIRVEAESEGECPHCQHLALAMAPKTGSSDIAIEVEPAPIGHHEHMVLAPASWPVHEPNKAEAILKEVLAPTYNADLGAGENVFGKLFQLLMFVFHAKRSTDIEFSATTCGKHTATHAGPAKFTAMVRVFRDISVGVGLRFPPPFKLKEEVVGSMGVFTGKKKLEYKAEAKAGEREMEMELEGHGTRKKPIHEMEGKIKFKNGKKDEYALYFQFNDLEFNLTKGSEDQEQFEKGMKTAEKGWDKTKETASDSLAAVKAWANKPASPGAPKRKINLAEVERMAQNLKAQLTAAFHTLVNMVETVKGIFKTITKFLKAAPQLGFKLESEIGFLGGDIFAQWGMVPVDSTQKKFPPGGTLAERYAPLFHKLHLESSVTLVKYELVASVGAMIDLGKLGSAKARIELGIGLEVKWSTWLELISNMNGSDMDRYAQDLTGKSTCEGSAEVEVKALGVTLYQAKIGFETGIVVEGKLIWELVKGRFSYQVNVRTMETGWYWYASDIKTGVVKGALHKLFEPKLLLHNEGILAG